MEYVTRTDRPKAPQKGTRLKFIPKRDMALLLALISGLSLVFGSLACASLGLASLTVANAAAAEAKSGYRAFAKLSNSEKALHEKECRKYGGRPVNGAERRLVLRSGRTDKDFYNVIWFGQSQYVTYKLSTSESITGTLGLIPYTISLCQF